jgi:hypothetical protein
MGKAWECHELIRKRLLSDKEASELISKLPVSATEALQRCKVRLGRGSVLALVRDNHAFHYPSSEKIDHAFDALSDNSPLIFYVADGSDATFYHGPELTFQMASIGLVPGNTIPQKIDALMGELHVAYCDLKEVLVSLMAEILRGLMPDGPVDKITLTGPIANEVRIPPVTTEGT